MTHYQATPHKRYSMLEQTLKLSHPVIGITLEQCYYHPKLRCTLDKFKCKNCQQKLSGKGCNLMCKWKMCIGPWGEVVINVISPWIVQANTKKVEFNKLTNIDSLLTWLGTSWSNFGLLITPTQLIVCTTKVVSLFEAHFTGSSTDLTSMMSNAIVKIYTLIHFANICTKQWAMSFENSCIAISYKIWHKPETYSSRPWKLQCISCEV